MSDDGPGFPFHEIAPDNYSNCAEYQLTHFHHTPSAQGHAPHVHLVFDGVGLAVVNALSQDLEIQSSYQNKLWKQNFAKGLPRGPAQVIDTNSTQGTTIKLVLDREIFGNGQPRLEMIRKKLFEAAHLFPGFQIQLEEEIFFTTRGLADLSYLYCDVYRWENWEPFYINTQCNDLIIQATGLGQKKKGKKPIYHSWVNGERTYEHGSHLDGFKEVMKSMGWSPAIRLIHVIMNNPEFAGPVKQKLVNPQVRENVKNCLSIPLQTFLQNK